MPELYPLVQGISGHGFLRGGGIMNFQNQRGRGGGLFLSTFGEMGERKNRGGETLIFYRVGHKFPPDKSY